MAKITKVISVINDDKGMPIRVRIQYIKIEEGKDDEILHDLVFIRSRKHKLSLTEKRIDNYVPPKRYNKMCKQAAAILFDKHPRKPKQQLDIFK